MMNILDSIVPVAIFNGTSVITLSIILIVSIFVISSVRITRHFQKQKNSTLENNANEEIYDNITPSNHTVGARQSLTQKLLPDQLVPPSPKLQVEVPYAEKSPWKNNVVPSAENKTGGSLRHLKEKIVEDARLIIRYMGNYWSPYWVISIICSICIMCSSAYELYSAQAIGKAIDQGASALISTGLHLIPLLAVAIVFTLFGERLAARLSSRIANDIRYDLFNHIQCFSQDFHRHARLGDLLSHFSNDINKLETAMGKDIPTGISELIIILAYFWVMIATSPSLALLSFIPMVATLLLTTRAMTQFSQNGLRTAKQKSLMLDSVQEGIRSQTMIAAYGLQSLLADYFSNELKKLEDVNTESLFSSNFFQRISQFSGHLLSIWILGTGGIYVQSGAISLGAWLVFLIVCLSLYDRLNWFIGVRLNQLVESSIGMQHIDLVLQRQPQIADAVDAYPMPPFRREICFDRLTFSYESENYQLKDISLTINAGEFVAFVGSSGAGKSTVFNLLMRFYEVNQGSITIDGHDLSKITQASLRSQIGIVLQETFLFNTTIMDNISIVKPEATKEEAIAAAQAAEIHDFISSLSNGYQTVVGEGGGRLSGGQRQRIAIARALLYNPPILLLDEPSSSLSAEIADSINKTILSLAGKHTIIMITHQLSQVVHADRIFVLKQGHLAEQGTHGELMKKRGDYCNLWQVQNNQHQKATSTSV